MCNEIGRTDFEEMDHGLGFSAPHVNPPFHRSIFSKQDSRIALIKNIIAYKKPAEAMQRIQQAAEVVFIATNVSGRAEVTVEWGGGNGPTISGSIAGSVSDNKGNKVEAKVEATGDSYGKATIAVEHDKTSPQEAGK